MDNNFSVQRGFDPQVPDWAALDLPTTWADEFDMRRPSHIYRFFRGIVGRNRSQVAVPENLPGRQHIPKYVLQEFHSLPNGNYSRRITRGYITGFEHSMLGMMNPARRRLADTLQGCQAVLDVGCAGGRTARAVKEAGVAEVWGLDPSPYLLQHAAQDNPGINFVQGVVENTGFPDERFDGVAACFLFHEIPPRYLAKALTEIHRILKPGGLLAVCEPSKHQLAGFGTLWKFGWRGLYFGWLARFVFEPFLRAWHKTSTEAFFNENGFERVTDEMGMPFRHLVLRKQ